MKTYDKIYKHQNNSCFYCKEHTELNLMEKEHVFPRSKGGKGIKNKVLSCSVCNRLKDNLTVNEFIIKLEENTELNVKQKTILKTLKELNNGFKIRENWHTKARYKTNDINKKPNG